MPAKAQVSHYVPGEKQTFADERKEMSVIPDLAVEKSVLNAFESAITEFKKANYRKVSKLDISEIDGKTDFILSNIHSDQVKADCLIRNYDLNKLVSKVGSLLTLVKNLLGQSRVKRAFYHTLHKEFLSILGNSQISQGV